MQDHSITKPTAHSKTGNALAWIGALLFLGEAVFFLLQLDAFLQSYGAHSIGFLATLGLALQKLVTFFAWTDGLLLAAMAKVLVLCCPLIAIVVGLGMMRSADNQDSAASVAAGEEAR